MPLPTGRDQEKWGTGSNPSASSKLGQGDAAEVPDKLPAIGEANAAVSVGSAGQGVVSLPEEILLFDPTDPVKTQARSEVLNWERLYKEKPGSRATGLNCN